MSIRKISLVIPAGIIAVSIGFWIFALNRYDNQTRTETTTALALTHTTVSETQSGATESNSPIRLATAARSAGIESNTRALSPTPGKPDVSKQKTPTRAEPTQAPSSTPHQQTPTAAPNPRTIPQTSQSKLQLFILAGQSNMSGRGEVPPSASKTNPQIWVFGNDYRWRLATEPIDSAKNQVDRISEDPGAGYSPAVAFATTLTEKNPEMAIGLIPCARGGTSIEHWRRDLSVKTLYGSCLKRVQQASKMGDIAGLLFFQGEEDAADPAKYPKISIAADQWQARFETLVEHWRSDLNAPELPVVFAQIGTTTAPEIYPHWAIVQAQQERVRLPRVAMITTNDLALQDYVHFTTASYEIIGKRLAQAFASLTDSQN